MCDVSHGEIIFPEETSASSCVRILSSDWLEGLPHIKHIEAAALKLL